MPSNQSPVDPNWPPGTVRIEDLSQQGENTEVVLHPKPTTDPNDPLVRIVQVPPRDHQLIRNPTPELAAMAQEPEFRTRLLLRRDGPRSVGSQSFVAPTLATDQKQSIDVATVTWGPLNLELGFSYALLTDSYAAGCGSLCVGGLFLVPFALKYGRRPIYVFSTAIQCGISVWSANMQTVADLMLVNVLSCIVGALAEVLVQMTVADVYFVHQRGLTNTIYFWFMTIGVTLAPLAGGFITQSQGWRWVWWWMAILFGAGLAVFVFFYEETMYDASAIEGVPVADKLDLSPQVKKEDIEISALQKSHATPAAQLPNEPFQIDRSIPEKTYWQKLALWTNTPIPFTEVAKHCYQPFMILFQIPGVFFMAVVYGVMTACTTVPVTTLSSVMTLPPYNFGASQIGLMGIPSFIGTTLGAVICGPLSDSMALSLARRNNGIFEPEMRLWLAIAFTPFVPAGLFMFGIGLNNGSHWLLPAFGLGVSSLGTVPASSAALTYLTDSYTEIIADSVVGVTFIRNLISTIFIFALQPWCDSVGLSWFYVTFGLISTLVLLGNLGFIYYGKKLRAKLAGTYHHYSQKQLGTRPN
ncbi:hypothetical protein N7452_003213 [Penicillium brevicompactum]|uniref:Major facilitator superfamily (MFS) profile domain-containing protein n=1 Tax=Penicillium brevicompactum TaxID=5074 RepID=A0A9W9QUL6_PENBR|nr:hypothetical protein N7452_003213 [Penicillium brevicompactum]